MRLFGEELREVGEGFELEGVAGGIEEEHCRLLADFALEAGVGFDDEVDAGGAEALGEGFPVRLGEDDAEVRDGDVVAIDGIAVRVFGDCGSGLEVGDDLVAEEVEVDPVIGAAAFGTAENLAIKEAGGGEIVDGKGDVKGAEGGHAIQGIAGGEVAGFAGSYDESVEMRYFRGNRVASLWDTPAGWADV
jgi:hypothetical protein